MKCLILLLCLVAAEAYDLENHSILYFYNYPEHLGDSAGVSAADCIDQQPYCKVKVGKKYEVRIDLITENDEDNVTVDIKALGNIKEWAFRKVLPNAAKLYEGTETCSVNGFQFPLEEGVPQRYRQTFSVEEKSEKYIAIEFSFRRNPDTILARTLLFLEVEE